MEEPIINSEREVPETSQGRVIETMPGGTSTKTAAGPDANPARSPGWFGVAIVCALVSVASSLVTVVAYDSWYAQKLVSIDIKGYITEQRDKYIAGKLTDDELKRSFDKLEQVVTAIPKNKAVLMGDLVVRNVDVIKP